MENVRGKITIVLVMVVVFLSLMANGPWAGDYHNSEEHDVESVVTLACAQCHTMHGQQGVGGINPNLIYTGPQSIYAKLIRADSIYNLCTYCHDGDPESLNAPDVFGESTYNASAGDFDQPSPDSRHDVWSTDGNHTTMPPGYSGTQVDWDTFRTTYYEGSGLVCTFCHDQHGNKNYRNLKPYPITPTNRDVYIDTGAKVSYYKSSPYDDIAGIWQYPSLTSPERFYSDNMKYRKNKYGSTIVQISRFCGECHSNFYEDSTTVNTKLGGTGSGDTNGSSTQWKRHPVGGIGLDLTNYHTDEQIDGATKIRAIDPDGTLDGLDEQPFCLTCHRAHGSTGTNRHSNLIFGQYGAATGGGGTGTKMRDTCNLCHNQ